MRENDFFLKITIYRYCICQKKAVILHPERLPDETGRVASAEKGKKWSKKCYIK